MKKMITTLALAALLSLCCAGAVWAEGIVDLNTASVEEMVAIEDIDVPEDLAKAIVEYREQHGAFKEPTDLTKVPGMTQDFIEELNPVLDDDGNVVYDPDAEPALAPSKC